MTRWFSKAHLCLLWLIKIAICNVAKQHFITDNFAANCAIIYVRTLTILRV